MPVVRGWSFGVLVFHLTHEGVEDPPQHVQTLLPDAGSCWQSEPTSSATRNGQGSSALSVSCFEILVPGTAEIPENTVPLEISPYQLIPNVPWFYISGGLQALCRVPV